MKIKQIASNHVEVTVTEGDLTLFDISIDSLTPDSPYLRTFLFKIMERVKDETGFDPKIGNVVVEAQRSNDRIVFNIRCMAATKKEKQLKFKNARAVIKQPAEKIYIYGFEKFSDMTAALSYINEAMLECASVYSFENSYYCAFRTRDKFCGCDAVMSEFCSVHDEFEFTEAILQEHGKCIASGSGVVSLIEGIKRYKL